MTYSVSQPSLGSSELRLVTETIRANRLTQGPMVDRFEDLLAKYLRVKHVVVVNSGTSAIHLALAALGIGPGDEVLVPDLTFVATANAVRYCGALPIPVEVNPTDWNISVRHARDLIGPRTRAIVPVHLYGAPCDLVAIHALAMQHNLRVVEDAAEGLGGTLYGHQLGTTSDAGTFSFYGNKVLTTGEGGAVATDSDGLADQLRLLRGQGQSRSQRYYHIETGFNYRLTDVQAAIGVGQMEGLEERLAMRRLVCQTYRDHLPTSFETQRVIPHGVQAPWLFTCVLPVPASPDRVAELLSAEGIETRPVFVPLHQMPMDRMWGQVTYCTASEIARRGISLPTYPDLTKSDVLYICARLRAAVEHLR